jgi:ABC-type sulfate transport system permease component
MTPGQATSPILWSACVVVPLIFHCVWRSYLLASLTAAAVAMTVDQIGLQAAYLVMQGDFNPYGLVRAFLFFPIALIVALVVGLPFALRRRAGP